MFPLRHNPPDDGQLWKWCPYCEEYKLYHDYACGHFSIANERRRTRTRRKEETPNHDDEMWLFTEE